MPSRQTDLFTDGLADRLADDIIDQLTSQGLTHDQQQAFVVRLLAQNTLEKIRPLPKRHRELFLVLITEALLQEP